MYYTMSPNDYQWGFSTTIDDLALPKFTAAATVANGQRAEATIGHPPAISVNGNNYDLKNWVDDTSWMGTAITFSERHWIHYLFNIPTDGTYTLSVANESALGGTIELLVDGAVSGSWTSAALPATTQLPLTLTKGLHSIRLRANGTEVIVMSVRLD
jgi:hypothetical protein